MDNEVLIKVSFEAKNTDELKLKIQEYSLAHLGLNLAGLNELRQPMASPPPPVEPKKRGRKLGWRKEKPPESREGLIKSNVVESMSLTPPATADLPEIPGFTRDDVKAAIHRLNDAHGFGFAATALAKFGAKHLNDVAVKDYGALIKTCEEMINEPGPSGAV